MPAFIARIIPLGTRFRVELTDEGILYRFVESESTDPVNLPEWARNLRDA